MIAFAARAAALVAAADPAAVAAVLADFPEAEEIGLRGDPASFNPHRKPPPKDPAKRAEYLREQIERPRKAVDRDIEEYNRYRDRGLASRCDTDINISSGANPVGARRTALRLKHAQISYGLTMSHNLRLELASTLQALGQPPQRALYDHDKIARNQKTPARRAPGTAHRAR